MTAVRRALDELRFGAERTLNLRESLPSAADGVRRCEAWLRSQQIRGAPEVLVITGRGSHSVDGLPVLKPAIDKLLHSLRRRGVIAGHAEHNPGAFVVTLAPLRALFEAPPRRRDPARPPLEVEFQGLSSDTLALLRELAERSLHSLAVRPDHARVQDEMHRHLRALAPGLRGAANHDLQLRSAVQRLIAEYD